MIVDKEKNFISAVVYVYNNHHDLESFIDKLYGELNANFLKFEIICVNDSSTDNSVAFLKRKADTLEKGVISIVNMSFHQGIELSMNAGVDLSIGDFVLEFDNVNNSIPVAKLMDVYRQCLKGYDIVSLVPTHGSKTTSKMFYNIFNTYSNKNYPLRTECFHIISRRAINRCQDLSKTVPYRKAVYADCGLKIASIECDIRIDNPNNNRSIDTAVDALILFTSAATKASIYITVMFMLACVAVVAYVVFIYLMGKPVLGWTTTMLFMSFGFLSIFIVLGIMLKYLSVIINLIFKNKTYVTESIEKLTK